MPEIICAGPTHRESEFALVGGVRTFGTCGPCALATALTNSLRLDIAPLHTSDLYSKMAAAGELMAVLPSPNAGMSNAGEWLATAKLYGAGVTAFRDYGGDVWADWAAFLNLHAGHSPTVLMVARNYLIRDEISGLGQNANTNPNDPAHSLYHIFTVYGRHDGGMSARAGRVLPPGYWVADGCNFAGGNDRAHNFQAADVLQFYSDATMAAAMPCAALALAGRGSITIMGTPQGWTDDGATLTAHNGQTVVHGFRDHILRGGWNANAVPMGSEYSDGNGGSAQDFLMTLRWDTAHGVWEEYGDAAIQALQRKIAEQTTALVTADRQIAQLQAQLAAAGRNAAIGAAMMDVLSLAANGTGGTTK